ncbi:hypothetical protein [Streptomyces sp. NPDC017993]|uniref:hypothetical protein n=1 Tax=Streptomyces sp. NPDC017993 TaxID=3365027 RepID=UPI0037B3F829
MAGQFRVVTDVLDDLVIEEFGHHDRRAVASDGFVCWAESPVATALPDAPVSPTVTAVSARRTAIPGAALRDGFVCWADEPVRVPVTAAAPGDGFVCWAEAPVTAPAAARRAALRAA